MKLHRPELPVPADGSRSPRWRASRWPAAARSRTRSTRPGTANQVTVALAGPPNAFDVGIYEAAALGYFKQTDIDVHIVVPTAGQDPVTMVHGGQALIGVSSEPNVLLHRNENQPVVGVARWSTGRSPAITIPVPKPGPSGGKARHDHNRTTTTPRTTASRRRPHDHHHGTTTTTPTTTTVSEPDATLWPAQLQQLLSKPGAPTYDGLVLVVRKGSIVEHARCSAASYRPSRAATGQPAPTRRRRSPT